MPRETNRCVVAFQMAAESVANIKKMLHALNGLDSGCRVQKHPDCCHLCEVNNDCSKVPVHVNCRCERVPYLYALED